MRLPPLSLLGLGVSLALTLSPPTQARELEVSGWVDVQLRSFTQTPLDPEQHDHYLSVGAEPEWYKQWDDGDNALVFTPFLRLGEHDSRRDHVDIRELNWLHVGDDWQVRSGISRVFWGVTESQHLVDIINQTDTLEGLDGEDRLGQPMIQLTLIRDWGDLSLFWLPYFRERTFAGSEGRPRPHPVVDTDRARYESDAEQTHQDFALRWSTILGNTDLALSHFRGTSREPILQPADGGTSLVPFYPQINQSGLEISHVQGDTLWKLEAIYRTGMQEDYWATVGGLEHTLVGVFGTATDLGLLAEYHYDQRQENATTAFQDDLFLGLRLGFNDVQSTELLAGVILDTDSDSRLSFIEASRRLGDSYTLSLEWRGFDRISASDPLFTLRRADHLQVTLARYF